MMSVVTGLHPTPHPPPPLPQMAINSMALPPILQVGSKFLKDLMYVPCALLCAWRLQPPCAAAPPEENWEPALQRR